MTYRYRAHVSKLQAGLSVHMPDLLTEAATLSYQASAQARLDTLEDMRDDLNRIAADLNAAIEAEKALVAAEKEAPARRALPRTPAEANARIFDYVMFGTPMFGGRE